MNAHSSLRAKSQLERCSFRHVRARVMVYVWLVFGTSHLALAPSTSHLGPCTWDLAPGTSHLLGPGTLHLEPRTWDLTWESCLGPRT